MDTRMYLFAWKTPMLGGRLGAPHAVDVPFVFGNLNAPGVQLFTGSGGDRNVLSKLVQDAWIAFARSGDPNHPGLPNWPEYRIDSRATLVFDEMTTVEDDPMKMERSIWDDVPFDGIRPNIEHCVPTAWQILSAFLRAQPSVRNHRG